MSVSRSAVLGTPACQYSDPSFVAWRGMPSSLLYYNSLLARHSAAGRRCSQYWTAWDAGWLFCTGTHFGGAWAGRQARTGTTCCAALEVNLDWDGWAAPAFWRLGWQARTGTTCCAAIRSQSRLGWGSGARILAAPGLAGPYWHALLRRIRSQSRLEWGSGVFPPSTGPPVPPRWYS